MVWNALPATLRDPARDIDTFKQLLLTIIPNTSVCSALELTTLMRYVNLRFTYVVTYLLMDGSPAQALFWP